MNKNLENLKQKYSKNKIADLIENDDDFVDIYCMLEAHDIEYSQIKSIKFKYFQGNSIQYFFAGEHNETHNVDDDYEVEIPPIIRIDDGYGIIGNDGNHRCNSCYHHNIKLPVVIINI